MSRRRNRRKNEKRMAVNDAFTNPAARLGFGTFDLTQATDYPLTRMTQDYQTLTSLYRSNWIVQNIVSIIPTDMIRKWYEVKTSIAPENIDVLTRLERKTKLRSKILSGMNWGRLYGGAVGLILIKGQDDLSEPIDLDTLLPDSFLGLQILDRWSGVFPDGNVVTDPQDTDFGLPDYYTIRDVNEVYEVNVHHSRVVRFTGRELPWLEAVTELYWGESEIEAVFDEIVRRDNVAANIAALTFKANVEVREVEGLDQMLGLGNSEMQRRFWNMIQAQTIVRNSQGVSLINKGDQLHTEQYSFSGLDSVYDRIMMDVAGASRIPVTKLFGRSPAGMNSTGESDMNNYYDYIDGLRETVFRPVLEKLLPIMAVSCWGQIPDDLEITFPPMRTPDANEVADITAKNTSAIIAAYQNDLIDRATAMQELQRISDETGVFGKIADEDVEANKGIRYTDSKMMNDPLAGLM